MITEGWHRNNKRSWMREGWFVWRNAEPGWYNPVARDGKLRVFESARHAMRAADVIIGIPKKPRSLWERLLRSFL